VISILTLAAISMPRSRASILRGAWSAPRRCVTWLPRSFSPVPKATADDIRAAGRAALTTYFRPVGTCAMGTVTDAAGRVFGFEGLHVVDASIIPRPLRASPNLTVMALAERIAGVVAWWPEAPDVQQAAISHVDGRGWVRTSDRSMASREALERVV
jgi:choline dehydrogenase-like flavoprotein